jgi:adenosylmethionine-8-amino-7-oxononanoate aminotransferase
MSVKAQTVSSLSEDRHRLRIEQSARRHLIQPWESMETLGRTVRTVVEGAEGVYVTDSHGNRLLDGPAGMWCVQVGHGRREIAEAMAAQALDLSYSSPWYTTNHPSAELAERIAAMTPGDLDHILFTTGGSTAVDSALRFVQFYNNCLGRPEKKHILSRQKAYHGSTYLAASCSGKERDKNLMDQADDLVSHLSAPNPYRRPERLTVEAYRDQLVAELENRILEIGPDRVAAFIAEPVLASGGVIVPPPGYHERTLDICRKYDVIYISDEVVTAFGRLGQWFASESVFNIQPDIITFAKGVTSGYVPLGGLAISDALLSKISGPDRKGIMFSNGFTYSGHPVSCAAALANIAIIEREDLLAHVRAIAPYFQDRLEELEDLPLVGEVRGLGLMACVECVADRDSKDPLELDRAVGMRIDRHCQARGLIVRPLINMCVMSPPLVISESEIDFMVDCLRQGIEATAADLRNEGVWTA